MGAPCWCCCDGAEEEGADEARSFKGAGFRQRCTDVPWLIFFMAYLACFGYLSWVLHHSSRLDRLVHGMDHTGHICGAKGGLREHSPQVYFPKLGQGQPGDRPNMYGVCVPRCPGQGGRVQDYDSNVTEWYVPHPTFPLFNRCIPYENTTGPRGTRMCAWPSCVRPSGSQPPAGPQQVCGLALDGTDDAWVLEPPDEWLVMGWQREGATASQISTRVRVLHNVTPETARACEVPIRRSVTVRVESEVTGIQKRLIAQYAGNFVRQAEAFYRNRHVVLGLGLAGSFLLSLLLIMAFSFMFRYVFPVLVAFTFAVFIAMEYIFFAHSETAGGTGAPGKITEQTETILRAQENDTMKQMFAGVAVMLAIALLFCFFLPILKQFRLLVELLKEAARTICEVPSLLLYPFTNMVSLVVTTSILLWAMLGVLTLEPRMAIPHLEKLGLRDLDRPENFQGAQRGLMWIVIFSYLWVYFYQVAFFTTTVAATVSNWYFSRQDAEGTSGKFWRPVSSAMGSVVRYHMGSVALGSLVVTLITPTRLALEHIEREVKKGSQEDNALLQCTIRVVQCCLWCLDKYVRALTEYTYIYIGMRGHSFCTSAHQSCKLVVSYPLQVSLDQLTSWILQGLSCILVPSTMATLSFFVIRDGWSFSAFFIFWLSFMVTRLASGFYDICISTLFLCAMHDQEHHGGAFASEGLRRVMSLPPKARTGIELRR